MLLKEVLDRLELPPVDAVPDRGTVAVALVRDASYRWSIPGTRIAIEHIQEGERAGEFLFDAATVDRIAKRSLESERHQQVYEALLAPARGHGVDQRCILLTGLTLLISCSSLAVELEGKARDKEALRNHLWELLKQEDQCWLLKLWKP